MAKQTTLRTDIKTKSDEDLRALVLTAQETLREERFKDKFSRKAGLIRENKKQIARAQTELRSRQLTNSKQ